MAFLCLLLDRPDTASSVCRIAQATTIGLNVVGLTVKIALATNHFTTADMNRSRTKASTYGMKASGAMEGVIIGVDDALQRNRDR